MTGTPIGSVQMLAIESDRESEYNLAMHDDCGPKFATMKEASDAVIAYATRDPSKPFSLFEKSIPPFIREGTMIKPNPAYHAAKFKIVFTAK